MDYDQIIAHAQRRAEERQKLLAKPDDLANLVADKMEAFLPSVAKPSTKYATRLEAIEKETPSDHPLAGVPRELYERTYAALQDPSQSYKSPYRILNELTVDRLVQPDAASPNKSRLERAYEYKRSKDTGLLGTGFFAGNVKPPLGYSEWLQAKREEEGRRPAEDWLASWGDYATATAGGAIVGGLFGLATGGLGAVVPSALTAAMAMIPVETFGHPIRKVIHETEWYKSKEEQPWSYLDKWKTLAADIGVDTAIMAGVPGISRRLATKAGELGLAEATGTRATIGEHQSFPGAVGSMFNIKERMKLGLTDPTSKMGEVTGLGEVTPRYGGFVAKGAIKAEADKVNDIFARLKQQQDLLDKAGEAVASSPDSLNLINLSKTQAAEKIARLKAETFLDNFVAGKEQVYDIATEFERKALRRAEAAGIPASEAARIPRFSLLTERPPTGGDFPPTGGSAPPPPVGPGPGMPPPQVFRGAPAKERSIVDALNQIKAAQAKAFSTRSTGEVDGKTAFIALDDPGAERALRVSEETGRPIADTAVESLGMQREIEQAIRYDDVYKANVSRSAEKGRAALAAVDARLAAKQSLWKQGVEARTKYSGEIASTVPPTAKPVDVEAAIQAAHEGRVGRLGAQGLGLTPQESSGAVKDLNTFYDSLNAQALTEEGLIKPTLETIDSKTALETERSTFAAIKSWLLGEGEKPPPPTKIYRGVLKGQNLEPEAKGLWSHGSPWVYTAGAGGKGGLGSYGAYDLYSYPAREGHLYYRGGSLAGDPLESTRINSATGMTWDQVLDKAKELYPTALAKEMKVRVRGVKDPELRAQFTEGVPEYVADSLLKDIRNATYETDPHGVEGIWRGREMPKKLAGESPYLRRNSDLERIVNKARKAGMSEAEIAQLPETKILEQHYERYPELRPRIKPQSGGDVLETPGPLEVDTPGTYAEQAAAHGLQFNGMQERINKPPLPLFTEPKTGATFALNEGETLAGAKARKLGDFNLASLIPAALLGAVGVGTALVGPSTADAGMIDASMGTVAKAVGGWLKTATSIGKEVEPLMQAVDKMHLNAVPIDPANPYIAPRAMEGLSLASSAMKDIGGTKEAIARTSKFFLGLDRFMTPYTVGEIFYKPGYNPAVELASRQEAWMKNTAIRGQVASNILDTVPSYRASQAEGRKAVIDAFEPLAKRHAEDVGMYRALEMREASLNEYLTAMGKIKNPKDKVISGIEKAQGELETIGVQKEALAPNVADFQAETMDIYDKLSKRYPGVRMSLAAEDTTTFERYPFLKGRLNYDEQAAVARIKGLMEDYRQRIDNIGLDTITDQPFMHHGWHPAWSEANVAKRLADLDLTLANALPYSKFFRRSQYSMQMVPEVAYNLERYIPDAEKRIQMHQFWDTSNPNGWWRHASSSVVQGSEPLRNFWQLIRDSAVPTGVTTGNQWMNRYAMFESLRLIGWAPSVAFKHLFKQAGTFASLGVRDTLATAPLSGGVAMRNYLRKNVSPEMLRSLNIREGDVKTLDEFVDSFVRQNRMQNILQDLDLRPYGNSVPDQVLNRLATHSGVLVGMVESFDRANSVMASMLMAQKAGMTAQQAVYSIYDTVLKNNFLGGVMNAGWMKDPWVRGLFLFQSTPFKIAERRLVQAYKTNQSLGKAWDVIPGKGPLEKLQQLAGVKNFVQEGEAQFKKSMILDALKSEKDVFGTPIAKQFAKEMLIAGLIIGGGGVLGLDLKPQVGHFPFLKADSTDPAISTSPILSSAFRVLGDRGKAERAGEDPDFFVTNFLQNWVGKEGYLPLTASKLLRISSDDVPERYKGSGLQYLFSVPSKKEKM
jgi:hypothetical protein